MRLFAIGGADERRDVQPQEILDLFEKALNESQKGALMNIKEYLIKEGIEKGREEARAEAREEARAEAQEETRKRVSMVSIEHAKTLLVDAGMPLERVIELLKLQPDEIAEVKKQIKH